MAIAKQAGLTITVNGQSHDGAGRDRYTPLLYVLRNELKLNAPKFGCGLGQCGACTVLVDGKTVRSCRHPVSEAVGKQVTTLEGPRHPRAPTPIAASVHR